LRGAGVVVPIAKRLKITRANRLGESCVEMAAGITAGNDSPLNRSTAYRPSPGGLRLPGLAIKTLIGPGCYDPADMKELSETTTGCVLRRFDPAGCREMDSWRA